MANVEHRSPIADHMKTSTKNNDEPCNLNVYIDANVLCVAVVRRFVRFVVCDEQTKAQRRKNRSKKKLLLIIINASIYFSH